MSAPKEYRSISKDEIRRKYDEGNWAEKRNQYKSEDIPSGNHKMYRRWRDEDGFTMLFIREYNNPGTGGVQIVVLELREGDVFFHVVR